MSHYAETPRLIIRPLKKADLPRMVELIGDWEVARWLIYVPHPYGLQDAEDFHEQMQTSMQRGAPEIFMLQMKAAHQIIGAVGLHPSREIPTIDELVIGYWLGRDYWRQGYASEAMQSVLGLGFARAHIERITSTTDPANQASQNVLRKAGFHYCGISPRLNKNALRGSVEVTRWLLTRQDFMQRKKAA